MIKTSGNKVPLEIENLIADLSYLLTCHFKPKIESIIINGSIAMGDFDKNTSDIDYVVCLKEAFTNDEKQVLKEVHNALMISYKGWGKKLEGSYVLSSVFKEKDRPLNKRLYFNNGFLRYEKYGFEWTFERYVLINYGLFIYGNHDVNDFYPVSKDEIVYAANALLRDEWSPKILNDNFVWTDEYMVYGVLTCCRILLSLDTGEVKTKNDSVEYVLKNYKDIDECLLKSAKNWNNNGCFLYHKEGLNFIRNVIDLKGR